jgi:hypothetical protein
MTPNKIQLIKDELSEIFEVVNYAETREHHFVLIDVLCMDKIRKLEQLCFLNNLYYIIFPLTMTTLKISIFPTIFLDKII